MIETLLFLTEVTGDQRFLKPVPAALAWIRRSLLGDGQIARFYELKTNTPLYFRREGENYFLTYSDSDLPRHYSFKSRSAIDRLEARYDALKTGEPLPVKDASLKSLVKEVTAILGKLDAQGRWLTPRTGKAANDEQTLWLRSEEFSKNLTKLSEFVARVKPRTEEAGPR